MIPSTKKWTNFQNKLVTITNDVFQLLVYNCRVNTLDFTNIKAVAFDIDGTIYRTWKFNIRMPVYFFSHGIFFLKYGLVRNIMHKSEATDEFVKVQAQHMAKKLHCSPEEAEKRLDKVIYKGLEKKFVHIKPCKGVVDLIKRLKDNGYKIAVLSDFPPEQKGDIWGIRDLCDVVLGSEEAGALKPASTPFLKLADKLALPPEEILYVGNNFKYDIVGAKNVGMKAAWLVLPSLFKGGKKAKFADFTFSHYCQLEEAIFKDREHKTDTSSES